MVYRYWYGGRDLSERRRDQIRAHPRAYRQTWSKHAHPAVGEACEALSTAGEKKLAGVVRSYFEDMSAALCECARVLRHGAPCWVVVGGARLKNVYIPTDTILPELVESHNLSTVAIRVARRLIPAGRKLGTLSDVAPRESILVMRKSETPN
jgi:hypothetical protein